MVSETARHKLHTALEESIGEGNAGALMQMLPPYEWHEIATKADLASLKDVMVLHFKVMEQRFEANEQQHAEFMGRIGVLETDVAGLKTDVAGLCERVDGLETKVDGLCERVDGLETKVDDINNKFNGLSSKINSDMAHALHRHTLANTGIMIAFLSLLVTALKLT